jgi:drug/metabolite transporter (DMT)-like permease
MTSPGGIPDEAFALGSAALWAVASALFTVEGRTMSPAVMNAVKTIGASLVFALVLLVSPVGPLGRPEGALFPAGGVSLVLVLSGLIGIALGDTCFFESLARIGVRRSMMIGLLAPVFTAVAAAIAGQPLPGIMGFAGISLTLGGILLVVRVAPVREDGVEAGRPPEPGDDEHRRDRPGPSPGHAVRSNRSLDRGEATILRHPGIGAWGFGVMAALCQAIGIVMTKDAIGRSGVLPASLLRLLAGGLGIVAFELLRGRGAGLPAAVVRGLSRPRLVLATLLGTVVAFYLFQVAVMLGSPPVTAALCATSPILVAPIAARWLGERMPWTAALGTLLAVGGVALVALD